MTVADERRCRSHIYSVQRPVSDARTTVENVHACRRQRYKKSERTKTAESRWQDGLRARPAWRYVGE